MLNATLRTIGVFAAILFAAVLPAEARAADMLSFGDAGTSAMFGANAIVRIDGSITYAADCPEPGIDDFFHPATDVYLVPAGSVGGELHDAAGGRPNTIVAGASFFVDEVIAVTAPAGSLDEGAYDVVYDTCQDGQYDPGRDAVFLNAVTVELPDVLPIADAAIRGLKDEAMREYHSWVATRHGMNAIFRLADRALKAQCSAGNAVGCAMRQLDYFDGVKERFMALLLSQSNHYLAIAEDPPDPNYEALTMLPAIAVPHDRNDSALGTAVADALRPLAGEAALSAALLRSVERYQGAQAAGDAEWALSHARQARDLAGTMRQIVPATDAAIARIRAAVGGNVADLDAQIQRGREFVARVTHEGLTAVERRGLRNHGRTDGQIAALETELRGYFHLQDVTVTAPAMLARLDEGRAAHAATGVALSSSSASWAEIVTVLEGFADGAGRGPAIDAGGPYSASEGVAFALAGSSAGALDAASWDLDADGSFDDATGLTASASFAQAGAHVIGLRATRGGHEAVSYAVVNVSEGDRAPVLSSPVPAERAATVVVGEQRTFAVEASDPDGDPVAYTWKVDGSDAGERTASLTFSPTMQQVGTHVVEVTASDGTASGGSTRRAWAVVVQARDADGDGWTATPDCDDADPAVHPTANELLGNDVDDDCDAGTPDAPPGGLTGSMWAWGSNRNGALGIGWPVAGSRDVPVPIPGYTDVVQVAAGYSNGFGVLASGEMRSWGFGLHGDLGTGGFDGSGVPVSPVPVGGGTGRLSGIEQIDSGMGHMVALRVDGSVLTWGGNGAGQAGNGSTAHVHPYPVRVLTGRDGPPLTGVREVEAGFQDNYAIMDDGTVRAWGQIRCDGEHSPIFEPFPVPLPLVGGDVRQVSSGNQWTLVLKKDGTVLSCGASPPSAGRPIPPGQVKVPAPVTGFGPGSGVIDVSAGFESGLALKQDGTVWAWGSYGNGSLAVIGLPSGGEAPVPVHVPLPPGPPVVDVEIDNACNALALRADGSVLGWGCDFFEQVGDGPSTGSGIVSSPRVVDLPGASAIGISTGIWNTFALTRPVDDPSWERPATWVTASVADATVGEASGGRFSVSLSAALQHDVTVSWSVVESGTAGASDVAFRDGTATVSAGNRSVEVDLPVLDDALDEDAEAFTIVLRDASNGIQLDRSQATGTIEDDDGPPSVSVQPASIAEGSTSLTDAKLTVQLSRPSGKPVAVAFATADGEATTPGDYEAASGRLVFQPGEQQAVVHVAVRGDAEVEPDETLSLALSEPEDATLGEPSATLTIADDEPLALSVESPAVPEGDDGTAPATFTVTLQPAPPAGATVSVDYELQGLTAAVPDDVAPAAGTLVFQAGAGSARVTAQVRGDLGQEPDEVFRLVLSNPAANDGRLVLPGDSGLATILDDDTGNRAPAAADDALTTQQGGSGSVLVLANDSDPDGDVLAVTAATDGAHGAVDCNAAGSCTYTPAAGFSGSDSFSYTASDGRGASATARVSVTVTPANEPFLLLVDGDSIGAGAAPNGFPASAVNDGIAAVGLRKPLPAFSGGNVGKTLTLHTGEVGDEGWFALRTIPGSWATAGPTADGLRNFVLAGPGLGAANAQGNREALLDKVPDVTPLRATGLKLLLGRPICAVVYKSDVSVNYQPLNGSLKGDNLGRVALEVVEATRRTGAGPSALPKLDVRVLDAETTCGGPLRTLTAAPAPTSSSVPLDVTP